MLIEKSLEPDLLQRAESIRVAIAAELVEFGGSDVSVSVLPLPAEDLPSAETLIELSERTLAVARHAGGARVQKAMTEAPLDLSPDLSLATQKALALPPTADNVLLLYQAIVPLHGAALPQYHQHLRLRANPGSQLIATRRQWLSMARQAGQVVVYVRSGAGRGRIWT